MTIQTTTDLLIIGGGPAGLSAATFFARVNRPFVLYDSGLYRNAQSPRAHTIMGFENVDPAFYRNRVREELEACYGSGNGSLGNGQFKQGKIVSLEVDKTAPEGESRFEAVDDQGNKVLARKVVLATGVKDILPAIPGIQEAWGKRVIHCIFCHGTETHDQPFAYLFSPNQPFNAHAAPTLFKLWYSLNHTERYVLTHGADVETPEGLKASGLEPVIGLLKAKGFQIICSPITKVVTKPETLEINFESHPGIQVPHMLVFPSSISPNEHAAPLLSPAFLKGELTPPFSAIPGPENEKAAMPMPRMGDAPNTRVPGLFWAGNSGSPMANVAISVAQGLNAGAGAATELGTEDMERMRKETGV